MFFTKFVLKTRLSFSVIRSISNSVLNQGTIYSLSSGHGKCGVAVIRVSGPQTSNAVQKLSQAKSLPVPRKSHLMKFYNPVSLEAIDKGLLLWFPGPRSFTGEDCAEFQVHGGPAVVMAMYEALSTIQGLRTAEAGEFTKRAFMNNKLDLTEVDGLADLIHAETEAQRKQALRQMDGDLSRLYMNWRKRLIKCAANVEAYIDFSEEENIEHDVIDNVNEETSKLCGEIESHLEDNRRGQRLRSGVNVAIIGQPNVGKSSLLNILCQRPAAIVSPIAGTTRDIVESAVNIGGYPVLLSDTAGLRIGQDEIEKEGIRRAIQRAQQADIKVIVLDVTKFQFKKDLKTFINQHLLELGITERCSESVQSDIKYNSNTPYAEPEIDLSDVLVVFNKIDLINHEYMIKELSNNMLDLSVQVSCVTEDGVEQFLEKLTNRIKNLCGNPLAGNPSLTQARYRSHLHKCIQFLHSYFIQIKQQDIVLAAHQLHLALREIGKITGKISSEDIIDVVFRDFCIGK
ncbi:tRNA modification GTPase GTPBP3, mitochondrial isoform X1 [Patella vulgata]|uniref:tRNA modification GTPase GTPBP3, mitochondrial isoform X1 n=2 Tax=Patella vulgata TaxID=6465 RepID=UPI00217F9539|nr:tRNA modification GTPase GTPBP3, mitochondrial isoform X1 [Patella vulgata]XP_050401973.1 tRNA modification GTPase GTPBP3, mitochondrial isoform X1 [Patella vulgata]XP_050401974.1 tRNA modification GTPase GTPBP3, mitochondrial isoform X1 [Patella vulgata]